MQEFIVDFSSIKHLTICQQYDIFRNEDNDMLTNVMRNNSEISKLVEVYSVVAILRDMRNELGLEAMSEFLDLYVMAIEKKNPDLKNVLHEALSEHAINHFYQVVVQHEKD
jgi:hypothetical protein